MLTRYRHLLLSIAFGPSLHFIVLNRQSGTLALGEGLHITNEVEYISRTNAHRHKAGHPCLHITSHHWSYRAFLEHLQHGVRKGCTRADVILDLEGTQYPFVTPHSFRNSDIRL